MDNRNDNLGVNKLGKNIRKSPLHQPNFPNPNRQQPEPQIYNINKNDFRSIVQQLTGPNSHEISSIPPPHNNPPRPHSERLQKIKPPPLTPVTRPLIPVPSQQNFTEPGFSNNALFRPQNITAESPVSAYMRYLQNSMVGTGLTPQAQAQPQDQDQTQTQSQPSIPQQPPGRGFPPLPSPTSQFPFPSPSFFNLSPYPPFLPGYQFPPPLSPNFAFSPLPQFGMPGPGAQPLLSPGVSFPLSPSGFFSFPSPTWRG